MNILIVGATSGIGHELWRHYAVQGNRVAVMGRRAAELETMVGTAPDHTIASVCDIADLHSFNAAFDSITRELGAIDLIIICAGVGDLNPDLDVDSELSTVRVNVQGWTNCVARAYKQLSEQGRGHLVTITSVGGLQPTPVAPSYSASKAYQINYTKSLQAKSKGTGIFVTEIRPGLVDTRMAKGEGLFWVMPLDKVTRAIIRAIDRKRTRLIVTRRWRVLNYLLKHFM